MALKIGLLEQSFKLVAPKGEVFVARFYERLFEKYPAVKPMFAHVSMPEQKKKLLASIVLVIRNLRHPDKLTKSLKDLGARHALYGTQPAHYDAVAENLLAVLAEFAGSAWTPEVCAAWAEALSAIKTIMLEGAAARGGSTSRSSSTTKEGPLMFARLNNLKTMTKLMAGFAAVGGIMAFVGYIGVASMGKINDSVENIYSIQLQPLMTLTNVRGKVHQLRSWVTQAVMTKDASDRQQAVSKIAELKRGIDENVQAFEKTIRAEEVRKAFEVFTKTLDDYRSVRDNMVLKLAMAGDQAGAIEVMKGEGATKYRVVIDAINTLVETKMKVAEAKHDTALKIYQDSQTQLTIIIAVGVGLGLFIGWVIARMLSRNLGLVGEAAEKLAGGDYSARATLRTTDEVGHLGQAFNSMAEQIQDNITKQQDANKVITRIKTALDNTTTNVMVCDRTYTIIYANKASMNTLRRREEEIRKVFPIFSVDKVIGASIDSYHKNPAHQRQLLDNPKNLPYHSEIKLGPLTLDLNAAAILSDSGEYLGNVMEWADITAQKKAQTEVDRLISAASIGQLSERIKVAEFDGFFKDLSQGVNKMLDAVVTPLHEAQQVLTALAANDLTKTMTGNYQGEFEQMKASLNSALGTLSTALTTVREGAESVTAGTEQITKGNEDLAQRTSEQASALEETSASMEEMTLTMKQNADNAKQANQLAIAARNIADKGGSVTTRAVEAMGEINKSSKKIADIITVIDEIAFQTNLLALNAAVEAARAGEHGRGFAVVAAEVRNLAQRSATAAKEIKGLINESIQRVNDGSELVNQSGKTLEEIVSSVKRVTDIIAEITAASQEQASGIDQVNKAIMQMDEATQENAALVEETTSASQSMKEQARELMSQVEVFKVSDRREASCVKRLPAATAAAQAGEALGSGTKYASRDTLHGSRSHATPKPAGVAAGLPVRGMQTGNGKDRRQSHDDFEEF
jgi:methyl-accepting chemotaxis protein